MTSFFAKYEPEIYLHNYTATLVVNRLIGGTPSDPKVAEGYIKSKLNVTAGLKDSSIQTEVMEMALQIVAERGLSETEAMKLAPAELAKLKHLNGFKRAADGTLYIEGRQLKACIKEAANIRWPKERWGPTSKGTRGFFAEHVFVLENRLPLGVKQPTDIQQRFISTFRGTGIQYEEYVDNAELTCTIGSDFDFTERQWGHLWVTAEHNGLGASRSQGFGTFEVTSWMPAVAAKPVRRVRKAA